MHKLFDFIDHYDDEGLVDRPKKTNDRKAFKFYLDTHGSEMVKMRVKKDSLEYLHKYHSSDPAAAATLKYMQAIRAGESIDIRNATIVKQHGPSYRIKHSMGRFNTTKPFMVPVAEAARLLNHFPYNVMFDIVNDDDDDPNNFEPIIIEYEAPDEPIKPSSKKKKKAK